MRRGLLPLVLLLWPALAAASDRGASSSAQLHALLGQHWEAYLAESPERALLMGDRRRAEQIRDDSASAIEARLEESAGLLELFRGIDSRTLSEDDLLNLRLIIRLLELQLEEARFRPWQMPVSHMGGIHLEVPLIASLLALDDATDFHFYIERLARVPERFEQTIGHMRLGMERGAVQPSMIIEKVIRQVNRIASAEPRATPFFQVMQREGHRLAPEMREQIERDLLGVIDRHVLPAYRNFGVFLAEEYLPAARPEPGLSAVPEGEEWYALQVRKSTTTDLSVDEIHQRGMREVARVRQQMEMLARRMGLASPRELNVLVARRRDLVATSRDQVLDGYRRHIERITPQLDRLFHSIPDVPLEVVSFDEYREAEAPGAQYIPPSADGSRPALVVVNTGGNRRHMLGVEATAYHEALPGHHLQAAFTRQLAIPAFRKQAHFAAYSEGWALYAERLGKEVGMFRDPVAEYGRLQTEMLRAIRLVVDTGINGKGWSVEQASQYFRRHSMMGPGGIDSELSRFIAIPGQALSYKIGEQTILELRAHARRRLGRQFDIRDFHDVWLNAGPLPLDLAAERVEAWIEAQRVVQAPE